MISTLTYSPNQQIQGWTGFFSFLPDWMQGMNNRFYTWKGGNLYIHNSNDVRNNFYNVQYNSTLKTVFNENILENKLYKTIALQGSHAWEVVDLTTDIQDGGYIEEAWFEKKEQVWFAFIRNPNPIPAELGEYALRSLNGIGRSLSTSGAASAKHINFVIGSSPLSIGSILSVGDILYYALPPYTTPVLCGEVTNIVVDYVAGNNYIEVDTTITGASVPPIADAYFLAIKNNIVENAGQFGHYMLVELENNDTEKVEIFIIESQVQKSFP